MPRPLSWRGHKNVLAQQRLMGSTPTKVPPSPLVWGHNSWQIILHYADLKKKIGSLEIKALSQF